MAQRCIDHGGGQRQAEEASALYDLSQHVNATLHLDRVLNSSEIEAGNFARLQSHNDDLSSSSFFAKISTQNPRLRLSTSTVPAHLEASAKAAPEDT